MAAVILQGTLQISKQQFSATSVAVNTIQRAAYSSDVRSIKKPALSQMRKGAGGRSSFNGVVATVFGSTGFLGRYVTNELGKHGTQMILPYRGDNSEVSRMKLCGDLGQVYFHPFELRDEDSIRQAVKYSNVVVNLIGRTWETKNYKMNDVHVEGARRLARISREMGVEKFIHFSALNATPNPEPKMLRNGSGFLRSKYYGELAVREEFPDAVVIRPSIIYGVEDYWLMHHAHRLRRRSFLGWSFPLYKKGHGISKMPVCVDDVATAVYEIIKNPDTAGKVYQAVGPHRYSLHDLVQWILNELRRTDRNRITDLRFSPLQIAKILLIEMLPGEPIGSLHRENLELEATTDELDLSLPTLVELGVKLTPLENQIAWILKHDHYQAHLGYSVEDVERVVPPRPIV